MSASLLFLTLGATLVTSTLTERSYDLTFWRPDRLNSPNRIVLACVDAANGELVPEASFFKNGELFNDLPQRTVTEDGVVFTVDRATEGNFTCGDENRQNAVPQKIVARPNPTSEEIENNEDFYADVGSTARLDCPLTPGGQLPYYYVRWQNASDHSVIFYQIHPPINRQISSSALNSRYSIDPRNFSLFIIDVGFTDAASDYQCVLGIVDPNDNTVHEYTVTQNFDISLFIFKAPRFITKPVPQVTSSGADVTFTCAVLSSPMESSIRWMLRDRVLDGGDNRFTITSSVENGDSGRRTTSSLTIHNVTGYDSGWVECNTEVSVTTGDDTSIMIVGKKAELAVLDRVQLQPPIPFQSGGFIFPIILMRPLLISVSVQLRYTQVTTGSQTTVPSTITYFNTSFIHHLAFREQVPYNRFYLEVGLTFEGVSGPMVGSQNEHSHNLSQSCQALKVEQCDSSRSAVVTLGVLLAVLAGIVLVLAVAYAATKLRPFLMKKSELKSAVGEMNHAVSHQTSIVCCPSNTTNIFKSDGVQPKSVCTQKMAEKFVDALDRTIQLCENDAVLAAALQQRNIFSKSADAISSSKTVAIEMKIEEAIELRQQ